MTRLKNLFLSLVFILIAGILTPLNTAKSAQGIRARYTKAIQQLRKEGYKGIDKALATFNDILKKDPDFLEVHISAADALLLKYEFSKSKNPAWLHQALDHLNICIEKEPGLFVAYFKEAIIYFNLNQPEKAVKNIMTALKIYPKYLEARILYLQYLLSSKKVEKAKVFADESVKYFPKDPAPLKFFGDVFYHAHAYEDAIRYYNQVLQLVTNAPYTQLTLGKIYQKQSKLDPAIQHYIKAIKLEPKLYEAHFNLGYCYSQKNKIDKAIYHLEFYSKEYPNNVSVLNNLALLYEQSGQLQKAKLAWLKTKEKAKDKVYKKRAETHLYNLIHNSKENKKRYKKLPKPYKGGKKDEEKK